MWAGRDVSCPRPAVGRATTGSRGPGAAIVGAPGARVVEPARPVIPIPAPVSDESHRVRAVRSHPEEVRVAGQRTTFGKLQRERAKQAKQAAKRDRRHDRSSGVPAEPAPLAPGEQLSPAELLRRVEEIHRQYDAGKLTLEDFDEQRADLLARLPVD